jgi:hypothetical protein
MTGIDPILTRMAMITTENTGGSLDVTGFEGVLQARREDPHGVVILLGGQKLSIQKHLLPKVGRFFLAAAILLGEDVNADWDARQDGGS